MVASDLFQRLSVGQTYSRIFAIYASQFGVFTKLTLATMGSFVLLWAIVVLPLARSLAGVTVEDVSDPQFVSYNLNAFLTLNLMFMLLSIAFNAVGFGGTIKAVADIYTGSQPNWLECLKHGIDKACPLIVAAMMVGSGVLVGYMLLLLPGIYLGVRWMVYSSALIIERKSPVDCIWRSWELTAGSWCYAFCTNFALICTVYICLIFWAVIYIIGTGTAANNFTLSGAIFTNIPMLIFIPLLSIMQAVIYLNLRVEKEGLNAGVLAGEMGVTSAVSTYDGVPFSDKNANEDVTESTDQEVV